MSAAPQPKILVIRGGAIGDFLLTLPAISLLREAFPQARLEILGYEHIVSLATSGGYADAARSIEYAAMAGFFNPKADLDPELSAYFASFQQIVSYLYDPDGFFAGNLRRCGVKNLIEASPKVDVEGDHATRQLARPLERLALYLDHEVDVRLRMAAFHQEQASAVLQTCGGGRDPELPLVAIHPGSGGERKNWPPERWEALGRWLFSLPEPIRPWVLLVGGESDVKTLETLQTAWAADIQAAGRFIVAANQPLPDLAALLARCRLFVGHDSGISHLAAAVGLPCVLLFGPTDPDIWAPLQKDVIILRSADETLAGLALETVRAAVAYALEIRIAG